MPQMKPMYWFFLLFYFLLIFAFINMVIYYFPVKKLNFLVNKEYKEGKSYYFKW